MAFRDELRQSLQEVLDPEGDRLPLDDPFFEELWSYADKLEKMGEDV